MFRRMVHILKGAAQWTVMRMRFGIDEKKVVVVLANDNPKLDVYAMLHLRDFMDRKYAEQAVVLLDAASYRMLPEGRLLLRGLYRTARLAGKKDAVKVCLYPAAKTDLVYDYYSFHKFSDRVVFTRTDRPKDNMLGRVLRGTDVDEEDAVCLGLYHLREVPSLKGKAEGYSGKGKKGLAYVRL